MPNIFRTEIKFHSPDDAQRVHTWGTGEEFMQNLVKGTKFTLPLVYPGDGDDGIRVFDTGIVAYTAYCGIAYRLLAAAQRLSWPDCEINVGDLGSLGDGCFGVTLQ